ncbi:MAG: CocE/NonD family hydrolase, partial [Myxococcales bacterium]|nr:CocE/NonD family hydrolase [Myxococcales bacterium]
MEEAAPYGQGWTRDQADGGDVRCADNQQLRLQNPDLLADIEANAFWTDEIAADLAPRLFVDRITVPTFVAGAWQDEQTGGQFTGLWEGAFESAPITRYTGYNGVHADGYTPDILIEWHNFLSFYVRGEIPEIPPLVRTLAPLLFESYFGAALEIPPDRFLMSGSFDQALASYEAEEDVRILFEAGAHPDEDPGLPRSSWEIHLPSWPAPGLTPRRWYFSPKGLLVDTPPDPDGGSADYVFNPALAKTTSLPSGDVNKSLPPYQWAHDAPGEAAVFISDPLAEDTVMVGPGSVDLWIRSTATEADLEVNLSEVRPDGKEIYVQSGWLRASHRGLAPESTELRPIHTHLAEDAAPLVPGEWIQARVELFPFAHAFRAGSSIRLAIDTPGGSRPSWTFIVADVPDGTIHTVGHDEAHPSSVVLPVLPGSEIKTPLPPCPSLRGQPCRDYVEYTNTISP